MMRTEHTATPRALNDQQLRCFRTNGFVVVRQQVPTAFLVGVQVLLERLVDERIAWWQSESCFSRHHAAGFADLGFTTRYFHAWVAAGRPTRTPPDYEGLFSSEAFTPHAEQRWLTRLAADALGVEHAVPLQNLIARAKFPADEHSSLPWHQDAPCVDPVAGADFVTAWIPLVDIPARNPSLEVSPMNRRTIFEPEWSERHRYLFMQPSDVDRLEVRRPISMRRGDLLLFGPHVPHRSMPNQGLTTRWSVDFRFTPAVGTPWS